ncbi:MAG: pyrroline-5-carboxylate reductase [Dehalococcoidia bacterium]
MARKRMAIIGGGVLGGAIVKCLLTKKVALPQDIVVGDINPSRRESLSREYGVRVLADNKEAAAQADLVILAVKPQDLRVVTEEVKTPSPEQLVLSVVAGATLSSLCRDLNHSSVVRAMPNMPTQIGKGITIWTASAGTDKRQKELAETVLRALGKEIYVADEKYLDMATALSGSGPAYVFLFIEALVDAGVHIGLPRSVAQELVIQTILGSALTVERTGKHPADLRNMVTSPGGTTAEALLQLEKGRFRSLVVKAVAAAYNKAKRLRSL